MFCPVCGQKSEETTEQVTTTTEALEPENSTEDTFINFASEGNVEQAEPGIPKKRNRKKIAAIVAAVVLVAAIGIGVGAHAQISNFIRKSFSDPVSYYQYVEKKNRDKRENLLLNSYGKLSDSVNASYATKNISYKLELGQTVKTLLSMSGMDFSKLENVEITVKGKKDKNVLTDQVTALINGQSILSLNAYVDYENQEAYVQVPEVSEKYIDFSNKMKEMEKEKDDRAKLGLSTFSMQDTIQDMQKYFPETGKIKTLFRTYTDLFIDRMDSVEKGTAEIEASGVRAGYTDLKVTCKGKKVYDIFIEFLSTLKEDTTMKEIVENIGEDAYKQYTEDIASQLEDLKSQGAEASDEDIEAVMHVYVDGSGDIAGRSITFTTKDEENSPLTITCLEPQKGSEVGTEISVSDSHKTYFKLSGKGTRKGGKLSGEYTLSTSLTDEDGKIYGMFRAPDDEVLTIKVSELDEHSLEDGYLNGSFTIGTNALAGATSYELQIDSKEDKKSATQTLALVCGGDTLVTLTAASTEGGDVPEVKKPDEGSELYDASDDKAMEAYMSEWDAEKFVALIKEKCGVDFSSYLSLYNDYSLDDDAAADNRATDDRATDDRADNHTTNKHDADHYNNSEDDDNKHYFEDDEDDYYDDDDWDDDDDYDDDDWDDDDEQDDGGIVGL